MRTEFKKSTAQIQTILEPVLGPDERLGIQNIDIVINLQSSIRERYYTGRIGVFARRGKIGKHDLVTISKTDTLKKGCYVAATFAGVEPDRFALFTFEGYDSNTFEIMLDDLCEKKRTIKRFKFYEVKSLHRIIHIVKISFVEDL